jgi:uncharacterized membrane protein
MATKSDGKGVKINEDTNAWYILAYIIPLITGIIVLVLKGEGDNRLKMHAMQSIFLGIIIFVVAIVFGWILGIIASLINLLLWLYGLYVGFEAYNGRDITIPVLTDFAKQYSGYGKSKK